MSRIELLTVLRDALLEVGRILDRMEGAMGDRLAEDDFRVLNEAR